MYLYIYTFVNIHIYIHKKYKKYANRLSPVPGYMVLVQDGLDTLCCENNSIPMAANLALPFPHQLASRANVRQPANLLCTCAFLPPSY